MHPFLLDKMYGFLHLSVTMVNLIEPTTRVVVVVFTPCGFCGRTDIGNAHGR